MRHLQCFAVGLLATSIPANAAAAAEALPVIVLSALEGATVAGEFVLEVDVAGVTSAKLVVDGNYVGELDEPPLRFRLSLPPGEHRVRVRAMVGDAETRVDARFSVEVVAGGDGSAAPATTETPPQETATLPTASLPADGRDVFTVDTVEEIRAALSSATPGQVIEVVDGTYLFDGRLIASASGTEAAPITLRGTRAAMLRTEDVSDDYGLHVTGDYWHIEGITVAHAAKGIVLDGSRGTVIDAEWSDEGAMRPSAFVDGYQTHSVYDGYGTGNVFRSNRVDGEIPGFGIGFYPALENVATCDNAAPDAVAGLVGDNGQPTACARSG